MSDCIDIRERVAAGAGDAPEVRAHQASCEACRLLAVARGPAAPGSATRGGDPAMLAALRAAVLEDQAADRGPVARLRSLPTPARRALALGAFAALAAGVLLLRRRVDLALYPPARLAAELAAIAALAAACVTWALDARLRLPSRRALGALLLTAAGLPLLAAALPSAHGLHEASLAGVGADLIPRAVACFLFGLATAAPIAFLMAALTRDPAPLAPRDALIAAAAGLGGVLCLALHCPITQPLHLVLGHAPVVLGVVVGWLAGRRLVAGPARTRAPSDSRS